MVKLVAASVGSRSPSASAASLTPQTLNTLVRLPPPIHDVSFYDREQQQQQQQQLAPRDWLMSGGGPEKSAFTNKTTTERTDAEQRTTSRTKQTMDTPPSSVYANTIAYEAYYGRPQPHSQLQEPKNDTSHNQSQNVVALADTMAYEYDRGLFRDLAF